MNEKIEVPTMKVPPLKKICMTIGQLPTSYLETMSYYEMLVWFVNYLRDDIIPVVNANGTATEELQELYVELQNYVNTYFDNLDVQEEVNKKLDEMVEDGTLQEIITQYLNAKAVFTFNTIDDLKSATNLIDGSSATTLGYYSVNDGGAGLYTIVDNDSLEDNGGNIIELDNGLFALLITKNSEINIKQFGAYGDGIHDDTTSIQNALTYGLTNGYDIKVIPTDNYYMTTIPLILKSTNYGIGDRYWNGNGSRFFGDYKAKCKIVKIGNTTSGIVDYDFNSTLICINETGTGIFIDNLTLGNYEDNTLSTKNSTSYSIYTKCSRSTYSNLNINSYKGIYASSFSSTFENIVFNCNEKALELTNGTSNTFKFLYAHDCTNPYDVSSSYSTFLNCASDNCKGSIYSLSGIGLSLQNCGCESKNAQYIINQKNSTWFNVSVQSLMFNRQVGDSATSLDISDCAVVNITNTGIISLKDVTIVEREYNAGNSYIFKLSENNVRFSTNVDNLSYYKNYSGTNNTKMKMWNAYHTNGYTPHRYSSGGLTFNYNVIGEGKMIPFIGGWVNSQAGEIQNDTIMNDPSFITKGIYLNCTGRYTVNDGDSIQYQSRPNLGDMHIFNDPKSYNALGNCVTSITNNSNYSVTKIPLILAYSTEERPTSNLYTGLCIFDTTLNKPIWYNGSTWKDANGTNV